MKICTCSLLGTVPALALATTLAAQDALSNATSGKADGANLQRAVTPANAGEFIRTRGNNDGFGFLAGGNPCALDNGSPADCFGAPAAQEDPPTPANPFGSFFAEAADDFEIVDAGSPDNPCRIDDVTFWVTFFGGDGLDHPDDITGVHVTVYRGTDVGGVLQPAGAPIGDGSGGHTNAIAQSFTPIGADVTITTISGGTVLGDIFQVDVSNLGLLVPKNETLWLAPAVQLDFDVFSQCANILSETNDGAPCVQIFPEAGLEEWTLTGGNAGCDPPFADGTLVDMAFNINGVKDPGQPGGGPCPYDCSIPPTGSVGTVALLELLSQWNGPGTCNVSGSGSVGTVDLLGMLAAWGACPGGFPEPANDECADSIAVPTPGTTDIDLKGATESDPPPVVTSPGGDIWYVTTAPGPGGMTLTTNADVFAEIYDGSGCPPGALVGSGRSMSITGVGGVQWVSSGANDYLIRLVNDLGIEQSGSDNALKGALNLSHQPALENCVDALPLALDNAVAGDNCASSGQSTNVAGDCESFTQANPGDWYSVTGPAGGGQLTATVTVDISVDLWDGIVSVYCGQCEVSLECVGSCRAGVAPCGGQSGLLLTGSVSWCAEEGEEYYVLVHGVSPPTCGSYGLEVTNDGACVDDPPFCGPTNDACADMEVATDTSQPAGPDQPNAAGVTSYDTTLATTDGLEDNTGTCNDFGEPQTWNDLWWSYETTCTGVLTFTTCPSLIEDATGYLPPDPYDTDLVIYGPYADVAAAIADCPPLPGQNNYACNDDDPVNACGTAAPFASTIEILVDAGDTYICRVGGWGAGDSGVGEFMLDCQEGIPTGACCTDSGTNCLDGVEVTACLTASSCGYQSFFENQLCADVVCVECEYNQPGISPAGGWTFGFSDQVRDLRRADDVQWVGGAITSINWVGDDVDIDAGGQCSDPAMPFDITVFAEDPLNPGFPDISNVLCFFDDFVADQELNGDTYDSGIGPLNAINYSASGLTGCAPAAQLIFIALEGAGTPADSCEFIWLSSDVCNGSSVIDSPVADPGVWAVSAFDLSLCINGSLSIATGACCVDGACIADDVTLAECEALFGEFLELETCATATCPAAKCAGATYQQRPYLSDEAWGLFTSDSEVDLRRFDDYESDGTAVSSVSFWAVSLEFDPKVGFVGSCTGSHTFEVNLYPDDGSGAPDIASPICENAGVTPSTSSTGEVYELGTFTATATKYEVAVSACSPAAGATWVSITADGLAGDNCLCLLVGSPQGNGASFIEDTATGALSATSDNLNMCINP